MSTRIPAGDKGTADRIEADDGYWVRLVTWQALDREGACMQHCVGDGDYDRLVGGEDLTDNAIWSLRDRDGVSILTVRIRFLGVDYAKGPDNHDPGRGASMQVRHLVAAFKAAGHALDVCSTTGIVLLEDGRTFRRDRLPPEVQAEREAQAASRPGPRFPSVHWMRNGRIEAGHLVVDLDGGTRQLVEVASHFAHTPEPVSDGPVDGFDLTDDTVTIRFLGGRCIRVPASGDARLVTRDGGHLQLLPMQYDIGPATVLARPANSPPGTPFTEMCRIGVPWEDLLAEQAAERGRYERMGLSAPRGHVISREEVLSTLQTVGSGMAEAMRRLGDEISSIIHAPRRSEATSPFGLSSIPDLQVTFAGGGSSGFTRATATPPLDRAFDLNLPMTTRRRFASPTPPGARA